MKIDDKLLSYLQNLTRLELSHEECEKTKDDLDKILGYMQKLKEAPDTGEKFIFINETELREDEPQPSLKREDALKNAPRKHTEYFIAERAVE